MQQRNRYVRVALLDMYEGVENQGMRCIRELVHQWADLNHFDVILDEFEVRKQQQLPDLSYDIYLSSGGPGSPLESEGSEWENKFFHFINKLEHWNVHFDHFPKKHILYICHSFQLACRYYQVATVSARRSTSFGVFPMHLLNGADEEPVFEGLNDPFYAVDSRDYQVIEPNHNKIKALGGRILAIEKFRPHVALERAVMAIRFNNFAVGTQFHPEADAEGMTMYLLREDKKETVIKNHGEAKWASMLEQLNDPNKIKNTYNHIIPNFLNMAVGELVEMG
jgi:GMP synthase-like glutamine amidotransferase